jgi:hypothetical protein
MAITSFGREKSTVFVSLLGFNFLEVLKPFRKPKRQSKLQFCLKQECDFLMQWLSPEVLN